MNAKIKRRNTNRVSLSRLPKSVCYGVLLSLAIVLAAASPGHVLAQRGLSLFGDVKIDDSKSGTAAPSSVTLILYKDVGGEVGRQNVSNRSRYRFNNLITGEYEIAIEVEGNEIARMRITIGGLSNSPYGFQQDLEFEWKPKASSSKPGVVSAADAYNRSSVNKSLFQKAQEAVDKKKYDQAVTFLKQIVASDKLDFQTWTLLGTVYLVQEKTDDAEKAYLAALEARPTFTLALIDLGKLRLSQKKFDDAIDLLTRAVESQPESADANFLLGEAYLQVKKGSKAIPHLNEAARLGRPDAHLRLGWLYNAAGLKDKAAAEYEEFLKKKPDYPDRNKLKDYITANKKN
jgi:tetratricopeptide (TPR) repeat protein